MKPPNPPLDPQAAPRFDRAARTRRNRLVALALAVVAVLLYVGIGMRWSSY